MAQASRYALTALPSRATSLGQGLSRSSRHFTTAALNKAWRFHSRDVSTSIRSAVTGISLQRGNRPTRSLPHSPRTFTSSAVQHHGHLTPPRAGEERKITFIDKDGQSHTFEVGDGDNLLDIAQANDLEMEGACGGSCACSTCHIVVADEGFYDKMEEPSDDENDMLDLAFGLTETSRLGCQVEMKKELDGLVVKLPSMTRNLQASDFGDSKKA